MISRATSKLIAEIYAELFTTFVSTRYDRRYELNQTQFYDYLYERDYDAWFLNSIQYVSRHRKFIEFLMKIHTGETLQYGTPNWKWKQREKLGQRYLKDLAEDVIEYCEAHDFSSDVNINSSDINERIDKLKSKLELDGYIWKDKKLLFSESDVLDIEEEKGILKNLVDELSLEKKETSFHHLQLSEDHYVDEKWDDSISNSRKFLESILQEVAAKHHSVEKNNSISNAIYKSPNDVRIYLKENNLIEEKEKKAIASVYGLLSGTGGHPYIAEQDQARLLRHLALTLCQFVLLRLKGYLNKEEIK